ncbi:MAG: NAD(P)/FAD-dependent oxidoreductase [Alkalispirochaetaceae bacterium]
METTQILIVGGGFAGIEAAAAASRRSPGADIRLIDADGYATMVPALPDIVSGRIGENAFARPLSEVLPERVSLTVDRVTAIDLDNRSVRGEGGSYGYEVLVLANGSKPNYYGFKPEGGRLHSVHSLPAARAFRHAYLEKARENRSPEVVVVGGGYTGLEVAAALRYGSVRAGLEPKIRVVDLSKELLTFLPEKPRRRLISYLQDRRIELITSTSLASLTDEEAELSNGDKIHDPLVCWSAGMEAEQEELSGTVSRTRDGRVTVNEMLQIPGYPEVLVAGDAANLEKDGTTLRRAVNFSYYSGRRAGANAAALLSGGEVQRFKPVDLGWVIPLSEASTGRILGSLPVGGRLGIRLHYFMCGFRHFGAEQRREFYKTAGYLGRNPALLEV